MVQLEVSNDPAFDAWFKLLRAHLLPEGSFQRLFVSVATKQVNDQSIVKDDGRIFRSLFRSSVVASKHSNHSHLGHHPLLCAPWVQLARLLLNNAQ